MTISCEGKTWTLPAGSTVGALWQAIHGEVISEEAVLADCGGDILDFQSPLPAEGTVTWVPLASKQGYLAYQRTLTMLLVCAVKEVYGPDADVQIKHSLGHGLYCRFPDGHIPLADELARLEQAMRGIVGENRPIVQVLYDMRELICYLRERDCNLEADILEEHPRSRFGVYQCGQVTDYYFGTMLPHMGYIHGFCLAPYAPGFLLRFPAQGEKTIADYEEEPLFAKVFLEAEEWGEIIGCHNVRELNRAIDNGSIRNLIAMAEARHEKSLGYLADEICSRKPKIRMVCIAGPSSAGKTTFMNRLLVHLWVNGVRPVMISLDDFYREREEGEQVNYENLSALDVELFQHLMGELLEGKEIRLPRFNFKNGERTWSEETFHLGPDQPVMVEGLHGLNPELTHFVPGYQCMHIYLGALTQLSINNHNRISTTDMRLLRRMVRDARARGMDAEKTLASWSRVRRGEEENIFLFQGRADEIFNTALLYELPVLKRQAVPLLEAIGRDSPQYAEAQRLLTFLTPFGELDDSMVPDHSILREFIGKRYYGEPQLQS